jgi:hypothetical protein
MSDLKKFKVRLLIGFVCYIGGMAGLAWLIGDSPVLGIVGTLGWIALVGCFLRYLALYRKGREPKGFDKNH